MKIGENGISSICLTKLLTRFSTFDIEWDFVFFKIVFFNIVFFNVAFTKSSNIAGILSFGGLLGLIRKRLVDFRLDFLAFIRIDQILTSPILVDIPPVFVFVQSLRQALLILVLWLQKMATECFFGSHSNFLCRLGHVLYAVGSCNG